MAALCTGSYGLSQCCTDDSKQYFFVKLTDSAYRAIEDYERNQNKYTTQAKIQISENGGVISFPTTKENAGQQFTFAIDEIEGSLECIQQKKTQLDVLGSLQYKMRIHANDDVYETTRHRMAVAEETQKKKSTVEIKPNQTDIGRRVKVKNSNNRFPNISSKREISNSNSAQIFQSSTACPNSQSSNLLINGNILSLSPSAVAVNSQHNNSNVSSSSGIASSITGTGHPTDINNISVINGNCLPIGSLSTQDFKNNSSNNSLKNLINCNNNSNNKDNNSSSDINHSNYNNSNDNSYIDNNNTNINKNSNDNNNNNSNDNNCKKINDNDNKNVNILNNNVDNIDCKDNNNNNNNKNIIENNNDDNNNSNNASDDNNSNNNCYTNNRLVNCNGKNNCLPTAASSLSLALSSAAGSGTSGIIGGYFSNTNNSNIINTTIPFNTANQSSGSKKNVTLPTSNSKINSRHNISDIKKRAIRERLIHMLALKNFKKPEIYARLQNEGIREKEKSLVSSILKDISTLRDNTFNLKHQIWNEINEDWPFYTEQDIQILKRRKPQNLTPPLSSDGGSSTSGQSPTSTNNGSPPPAVKRPGCDRGVYYEEPMAKKQRISHFKKDASDINSLNNAKLHHEVEVNNMGLSYSVLGTEAARRISPRDVTLMNGQNIICQQETYTNHNQNTSGKNSSVNYKNNNCIIGKNTNSRQKSPSSHNYDTITNNSSQNNNIDNNFVRNNIINDGNVKNIKEKISSDNKQYEFLNNGVVSITSADDSMAGSFLNCANSDDTGPSSWSALENSRTINSDTSLDDLADNGNTNCEDIRESDNNNKYDFSRFKKITTLEQRRKYKTEFGNDYDEYRKLLNEIDRVRTRFNVLAQQLNNARNNDANYRSIKRQIIEEYQRIQSQREHQNIKARFNYLHGKLAHIKKLVNEFDKTLTASDTTIDLSLSSELLDNSNYRPITSSTQNDDIGDNYTCDSKSEINCDNNRLESSSSPKLMSKSGGTTASAGYHLPKTGNY